MIRDRHWFGRELPAYDAESDLEGLIPWYARANRPRYAHSGAWGVRAA